MQQRGAGSGKAVHRRAPPNPATKNLVDSLIKSIDSAKRVVEDLDKIPYWMQRLSILTESKV